MGKKKIIGKPIVNKIIWETLLIVMLASVLGVLNNFRPKTAMAWVRDWPAYHKELLDTINSPDTEQQITANKTNTVNVTELIQANFGITEISLETAFKLYSEAFDQTIWIDARDPVFYKIGHIRGAVNCFFYEINDYLPKIEQIIEKHSPTALVVYCEGRDCHDSLFLAEDLAKKGYTNIFVYKDGYEGWEKSGYPTNVSDEPGSVSIKRDSSFPPTKPKQPGMFLEAAIRDLLPFIVGILFLFFQTKWLNSSKTIFLLSAFSGIFFIWAAIPKIINPLTFATNIWNYDLAPAITINLIALILPWIEFLGGAFLLIRLFHHGSRFSLNGLLIFFIILISINILRGHEFNCGCTPDTIYFTDYFLTGWNDKYTLILRDVGLLLLLSLSWLPFLKKSKSRKP
jgi:rhodanese-related sulfurtransferase